MFYLLSNLPIHHWSGTSVLIFFIPLLASLALHVVVNKECGGVQGAYLNRSTVDRLSKKPKGCPALFLFTSNFFRNGFPILPSSHCFLSGLYCLEKIENYCP